MSVLGAWKGWRTFKRLPWEWRNLVFYAESGQDWHHFRGLIEQLNDVHDRKVCYVTSDAADEGLSRRHRNFRGICIPEGLFLTVFFQINQSDVFVLTMMDLGNLQLKRSLHPVHYVYVFHSLGSTHMADHADSFDHYDTLFCAGPHHVAEIRKRETLYQLKPKALFDFGHPRLEEVISEGEAWRQGQPAPVGEGQDPVVVLIAPTWGDDSILNACGEELIAILLEAGFTVIMRPHYQTRKLTPAVIDQLLERFLDHPRFEYVDRMGETGSLLRSDVLISDWSAMALEYALGLEKPVLFIDLPRRIRNPNWQELGLEPVESAIRGEAGEIVAPERLDRVPDALRRLTASPERFRERVRLVRDRTVFRLGSSIRDGAAELARIAARQQALRLESETGRG